MERVATSPNAASRDQEKDAPWAAAAKHWADRQLELVQDHEQLLKRREALLRTTECYFDLNTQQTETFVVDVHAAAARNEALLKGLDQRLRELREGHQPSAKLGMLKNNYWVMVKRVFPVWAEELYDYERRKGLGQQSVPAQRSVDRDSRPVHDSSARTAPDHKTHNRVDRRSGSTSASRGTNNSVQRSERDSAQRSTENSAYPSGNRPGSRSNDSPERSGNRLGSRSNDPLQRSGNRSGSRMKDSSERSGSRSASRTKDSPERSGTRSSPRSKESTQLNSSERSDRRSDTGQKSGKKSTPRSKDSTQRSDERLNESTQRSTKSSTRQSNYDASLRSALARAPRSIVDMDYTRNYNNNNNRSVVRTQSSQSVASRHQDRISTKNDSQLDRSPVPRRSSTRSQSRPSFDLHPARSTTSPERGGALKQTRSISASNQNPPRRPESAQQRSRAASGNSRGVSIQHSQSEQRLSWE